MKRLIVDVRRCGGWAALVSASPAAAADLECNGTYSGTFDDVVVPERRGLQPEFVHCHR